MMPRSISILLDLWVVVRLLGTHLTFPTSCFSPVPVLWTHRSGRVTTLSMKKNEKSQPGLKDNHMLKYSTSFPSGYRFCEVTVTDEISDSELVQNEVFGFS